MEYDKRFADRAQKRVADAELNLKVRVFPTAAAADGAVVPVAACRIYEVAIQRKAALLIACRTPNLPCAAEIPLRTIEERFKSQISTGGSQLVYQFLLLETVAASTHAHSRVAMKNRGCRLKRCR